MNLTRRQHVAKVVKEARLARGISQAELAAMVGVHQQTIGNLERATVEPGRELLTAISRELDVRLSDQALASDSLAYTVHGALVARLSTMDESDSLLFMADVLRYVSGWSDDQHQQAAG